MLLNNDSDILIFWCLTNASYIKMATLPRTYSAKSKSNLSSPFSNSPRNLQEVSLPVSDSHDVTGASGVSLKQYEEQLNALKKENFHLKLRVYFLEEKLGNGSPPSVQGLLELNVRLQVEIEELKLQLKDTQGLIAAAAEAIDVLQQRGSISSDSAEGSINLTISKTNIDHNTQEVECENADQTEDDTCHDAEINGDTLGISVNDESNSLSRLRREYGKALQMIKGCFKKMQQQEKEIKKLKVQKDGAPGQVSNETLEKYQEILNCKDNHIKDLEHKLKDLQNKVVDDQGANTNGNLQALLTRRMQGLAYFLDKLLSHKCVIGEDNKKFAESILEQTLSLPVDFKLDESLALEDCSDTMDESNMDISQTLKLEDLTMMFGHHMSCGDGIKRSNKKQIKMKQLPHSDVLSESECWSEPDRNVSLARMGLQDVTISEDEPVAENSRHRARRSRISHGSRADEMAEGVNQLVRRIEDLKGLEQNLNSELTTAKGQVNQLIAERDELTAILEAERNNTEQIKEKCEILTQKLVILETQVKDAEIQVIETNNVVEKLRADKIEMESTFLKTEQCLRRAADEATVQASQAALDRARAQNERLLIERQLEETRDKLNEALDANTQLNIEITNRVGHEPVGNAILHDLSVSDDDRPMSPDQGIDSDRLSSLEHNDGVDRSQRALYEENACLKQKLARTKATLADALFKLNAANLRKKSIQHSICREIHKTHNVLRQARLQFENKNEN